MLGTGLLLVGAVGQRVPVGVSAERIELEDPDVNLPEAIVLAPYGYPLLIEALEGGGLDCEGCGRHGSQFIQLASSAIFHATASMLASVSSAMMAVTSSGSAQQMPLSDRSSAMARQRSFRAEVRSVLLMRLVYDRLAGSWGFGSQLVDWPSATALVHNVDEEHSTHHDRKHHAKADVILPSWRMPGLIGWAPLSALVLDRRRKDRDVGCEGGVVHETKILHPGAPWGFGSHLGDWLAPLQPVEQKLVGVDCGLIAIELAHAIDVLLEHLDEHLAVSGEPHDLL